MQKKHLELLEALCERELARPLQSCPPESVSANDAMSYLWPLNERFRPRLHQIKTVRYRKQYESAADKAISDFVLSDSDWSNVPLVVWRVLLERHQQGITLCVANAIQRENATLMHVPFGLSDMAKTKYAIAWLCYAMKLPYKVTDESALDIDTAFEHLAGKPH